MSETDEDDKTEEIPDDEPRQDETDAEPDEENED